MGHDAPLLGEFSEDFIVIKNQQNKQKDPQTDKTNIKYNKQIQRIYVPRLCFCLYNSANKLKEELHTQGSHHTFTCIVKMSEKVKIAKKKVSKINLRIISKSHAHLQSMVKTSVKFQKNQNKTIGGVVPTR